MNTQNNHAHVRIKTCIGNDHSENGCVPRQRAIRRYQERGVSAQLRNNLMHVIKQNKSKQPINYKITYVGPPLMPDLF